MAEIVREQPGKPKISNFDAEVVIKKDVVSLYVAMYDVGSMEVSQCTSSFYSNAHTSWPCE